MKFKVVFACIFMVCNLAAYAQMAEFQISVSKTEETCSGNGTITVNIQNQTAGSTIKYNLYLLPDLSEPLFQFTAPGTSGLTSGDYRLVAEQTLGNESNTATVDFTIEDQTIPLEFTVNDETVNNCLGSSGILTVNVTSGRAPFFYEIFSGPVIRPLQASNTFTNLPSGEYVIRVIDDCVTGRSLTYTLQLGTTNLSISGVSGSPSSTCTSIEVSNTITPAAGTSLIYPLQLQYTIHPATGPDQVITSTITTGDPDSLDIAITLPLNGNEIYTYDIVITDSCNQNYSSLANEVNPNPIAALSDNPNMCGDKYLTLTVSNYAPPYTITFTDFPSDFIAADYNPTPLGPFTNMLVTYGSETNTVPFGLYTVEILDSCGRTGIASLEVIEDPVNLEPVPSHATCSNPNGAITITLPFDRVMVTATIIDAPADYTPGFPHDVSAFITDGDLFLVNLPVGIYVFTLTDECGDTITPIDTEIKEFESREPIFVSGQYCEPGRAALRIRNPNARLVSLIVTDGPPEYSSSYPVTITDVNPALNYYDFQDIPPGTYSITLSDACNITQSIEDITVIGYDPGSNNFIFTRNCGSFNLRITDSSNKVGNYWLQRYNPVTEVWEHPGTAVPYTEGSTPTSTNSVQMSNGQLLINRIYTGEFRILKTFLPVNDTQNVCIETMGTFNFSGKLDLIGAYSLDCTGGSGPSSVYLEVEGRAPFLFRILTKDGDPFPVENGGNNVFNGLGPGLYEFQIEDGCGNLEPATVNIGTLVPLVRAVAPAPDTMLECVDQISAAGTEFNLENMQDQILGGQDPTKYIITYHLSEVHANSGLSPIPNPAEYIMQGLTLEIYVRVEHITIKICHATTKFTLFVSETPVVPVPLQSALCDGSTVLLSAPAGFDEYSWSTGEGGQQISVDQAGNYTLSVRNYFGGIFCESAVVTYPVILSGVATSVETAVTEWTETENTLTVHAEGPGEYLFSLDGVTFQEDNIFEGIAPGLYTLEVKDINKCGSVFTEVLVFNYPKFFTPNGDGINDSWHIRYAQMEPGMEIIIFDRYGKMIKQLTSESAGWDGTYNGNLMPSSDYWFLLTRNDNRVVRGHFSMKR